MEWHESTKKQQVGKRLMVGALVAMIAGAGAIFVFARGSTETPEPSREPLTLVALEEPAEEPALEPPPSRRHTDALVRALLGDLLPVDDVADLVRRFVSAVNQIADGENPRAQLEFLGPEDGFRTRERKGQLVVNERSHRRYDAAADMFAGLDPTRAAAIFHQLEPVLDGAHQELGARDRTFRVTLGLAIDRLVQTPIPEGPIELRRHRMLYLYADPSLEALSKAQKQLLRMGPRNVRIVQSCLRDLGAAIEVLSAKQHARLPNL